MNIAILKNKANDVLNRIRSNPVADAGVRSLLEEIPIVGTFLLNLYDNSSDSDQEKIEQIKKILSNFEKMNEKSIRELSEKIDENRDRILENSKSLNILKDDTTRIVYSLEKLATDENKRFEDVKIEFKELRFHVIDQMGHIMDKVDDMFIKQTEHIDSRLEELSSKLENIRSSSIATSIPQTGDLLVQEGFSEAREMAIEALSDPRFTEGKRTFEMLRIVIPFFSAETLRKILIYSGAIKFGSPTKELWGLATRTINLSKFSQQEIEQMNEDLKNNPERVAQNSMKIVFKDPRFPQGIRSLEQIMKYFTGFSERETQNILLKIHARGLRNNMFKL